MQEQLITFETAKLAKEKGLTLNHFSYCPRLYYNKWGMPVLSEGLIPEKADFCITQSLLQKWLREVHNIIVFIEPKSYGSNICKFLYNIATLNNIWVLEKFSMKEYNSYEEALEIGLQEALNLIQNE